ncbi:MAG: cation:proton antiporter [Candidatus Nanoarchaeia archaeon]|nr:cation:proton antiporter [Candidatus Nanoarchaeia archaeon]
MDALFYLTSLAVILAIGILCTLLSEKLKIPNVLLLVLAGIVIGHARYYGDEIINFSPLFLTCIGTLALVMIIFDSSSRFKLKEFDTFSFRAMKLAIIFLFLNLIILTIAVILIFGIKNIFLAMVFSALMAGTAPDVVLTMLRNTSKNRVIELLNIESIINTPLVVLIPFIILDFLKDYKAELFLSKFMESVAPFINQFVTGIGAGILIGIIVFKVMRTQYSESLSPLALITTALVTYILAENLKGNGVLAVTTLGLFFGNIYVKEKESLHEFSYIFANSLEILVFVLVGIMIKIPLDFSFFAKSVMLFIIYLVIRYMAVQMCFSKLNYSFKEKLFMSLNVPKGIAVTVVVFILATFEIEGIEPILNLILIFIIYSIVLSTIVVKASKNFLEADKA